MKKREILTNPLSKEQFWAEFRHFVAYFLNMGISECSVLFGFAWGIEYYPGKDWIPETIPLEELEARNSRIWKDVASVSSDTTISLSSLPRLNSAFANDTDIHIVFESTSTTHRGLL